MYLFPNHQENIECLLQYDGTHPRDVERRAMFYIFAENDEIMNRIDGFYDLEEKMIRTENDELIAIISSGTRALIMLGFNLYNNYRCGT